VSVDFFSAGASLLAALTREGTLWRATTAPLREKLAYTSGGQEDIELSRYDAFVVTGTGFGLDIPKFTDGYDIASTNREPEGTLLSRASFAAMIASWFENSLATRLIDTIREVSEKPVLLCAASHLSERVLEEYEALRDQKRYRDPEFLDFVVSSAKAAGTRIAARHRHDLVWQDDATVGVNGVTKIEYSVNALRFTMKTPNFPPFDRKHGNEDYGAIMLGAILRKLDILSNGRILPARQEPRAAE
jgi:hypothetical protein